MKIRCWFGFHKWKVIGISPISSNGEHRKCEHCGKRLIVIFAIMEADLKKLYNEGKISQAAYESSLSSGVFERFKEENTYNL